MTYQERVLRSLLEGGGHISLDVARTDLVRLLLGDIDRLRAELAKAKAESIRPPLTWSSTPPTEPGHYWIRDPEEPAFGMPLVTVRRNSDGELRTNYFDLADSVEWWGPVPKPS